MDIEQLQSQGWVTALYPWEHDQAVYLGTARTGANEGQRDRRSYDPDRIMTDNVLANIHSTIAEIGTSRLIGAYCYNAIWGRGDHGRYSTDLPDALLATVEIEIKWRRTAFQMPVDEKDMERNRLVLWAEAKMAGCVCPNCAVEGSEIPRRTSQVRLLGGGYAAELWAYGKPMKRNDGTIDVHRVGVHHSKLTPISLLLNRN
jgi:hypothetical protein